MIFFAHGNDPQALPWFVLLSNWTVMLVVVGMTIGSGYWLSTQNRNASKSTTGESPTGETGASQVASNIGWVGIALGCLMATAIWVTRQTLYEAVVPGVQDRKHQHALSNGGQVAMWGDYHVEIARHISGEYRVWFADAYQRPIGSDFFSGVLLPRNPKTKVVDENAGVNLEPGLERLYHFALMDPSIKSVQLRLNYPGGNIKLNFAFDESQGRRSLLEWCGSRGLPH